MLVTQSHDKIALLWTWIEVGLFGRKSFLFEIIREMSCQFFFLTVGFSFQQGHIFDEPKPFLLLWQTLKLQKNIHLQMWNIFDFDMDDICHLNSLHWQWVQSLPESIQMTKIFLYQMTKFVHIFKWIFCAISSFALRHEITSSWNKSSWYILFPNLPKKMKPQITS